MINGKSPKRSKAKRRYKAASVLCNCLGTFILVAILVICVPLTLPRLLGYEIYDVVSGSMEPEIPTGSIVYVRQKEPAEIQEDEVLAFISGDAVVIHRVVENRRVQGEFVTKGDANNVQDMENTPYSRALGVVSYHAPQLGKLSAIYTSQLGKYYALGCAIVAMLFYVLASRLRALYLAPDPPEEWDWSPDDKFTPI